MRRFPETDRLATLVAATISVARVSGDEGGAMGNTGTCTLACKLPKCGDGFKQPGEECDDGKMVDEDACINTCKACDPPGGRAGGGARLRADRALVPPRQVAVYDAGVIEPRRAMPSDAAELHVVAAGYASAGAARP